VEHFRKQSVPRRRGRAQSRVDSIDFSVNCSANSPDASSCYFRLSHLAFIILVYSVYGCGSCLASPKKVPLLREISN